MIRLHHVPFSRSFRILWLLEEMGLDFDILPYRITDGSLRAPDFVAVSPAARVPGLEIDGLRLFESGAIVEYLCESRPEHGFARSLGDTERPRYLQLIHFAETMAGILEQLNLNHLFLRDPSKASPTVIKINTRRLASTLSALEDMLRDDGYLLHSGFSGADAMLGFNLFAAPYYVPLDPFPKLRAYRDRLAARPAYKTARAKDGVQDFYTRDFYPVPEEPVI